MLESTATGRIPGIAVSILTSIIFFAKGVLKLSLGFGILIGATVGSYIGTHYAIKLGNQWVKRVFLVAATVMAVILLIS